MGSSTATLRRLEKSFLPFLFLSLLLAFGMMECAPAEAARVLKANLVNPNGPTSAHNALQSSASSQFFPVPAAEHPPPVQTAVGSEPSDGSAAVTSEPSIDPLVVVSAVNGGDEEAGNEPDGAVSSAAATAPVPNSWLRPAQMPNDPQPNDHGPFLLETDPMPAVGSEEEAPVGNEDVLVPEIYVALPEEAAPAEAPAGSQGVAPTPDGADSSGSGPVPTAWLRQAKVEGDHQVANDDLVPNNHGPYLLGTDAAIPAVGSQEEAPAGNEDVLVPEIYVALPEEAAPGEAPAAGSQGVAPMPDGADSGGSGPVPSAWLRQAKVKGDNQVENDDQVPNDHGPYLLGTDAAIPAVGSEEAPAGNENEPVPAVLVPQPEEAAPGEAPAGNEDVLVPEIYVALPEEAAPGEASAAGSQGVAPMPDGAESSGSGGPVPSAWLRQAKVKGDHQVANDDQVPNDHGPYFLGTDAAIPPGEAPTGNEDVLVPEIYVALPEEAAPAEAAVAGSQGVAPMPDGAESSALVPIPNDHGPYLLGVDSTVGSEQEATVGEEQALLKMPAVIVPLPEENAPGEAAAGSQVVPPEN